MNSVWEVNVKQVQEVLRPEKVRSTFRQGNWDLFSFPVTHGTRREVMTLVAEEYHSASFHNSWDPLSTLRCPELTGQIAGPGFIHLIKPFTGERCTLWHRW